MRRARAAAVPPALAHCLETVLGAPIGAVRVIEYSRFVRLHGRALATTRAERIYLRDGAAEFFANPWLMLHEYCHVVHQWRPRRLTASRYLLECLRRGYWNNRFEVEARAFADLNVARLRALLAAEASAHQGLARAGRAQPSSASRR